MVNDTHSVPGVHTFIFIQQVSKSAHGEHATIYWFRWYQLLMPVHVNLKTELYHDQ
jgi:hypothetical protein